MKISVETCEKPLELLSFNDIHNKPGLYTYKPTDQYHRKDFFVVTGDGVRFYIHPYSKTFIMDEARNSATKCLVRLEEKLVLDFSSP